MRKLLNICRTSVYLHASIVGLAIGVGNSAVADLTLESSVQGIHGGDRRTPEIMVATDPFETFLVAIDAYLNRQRWARLNLWKLLMKAID